MFKSIVRQNQYHDGFALRGHFYKVQQGPAVGDGEDRLFRAESSQVLLSRLPFSVVTVLETLSRMKTLLT